MVGGGRDKKGQTEKGFVGHTTSDFLLDDMGIHRRVYRAAMWQDLL